MSLLAMGLRPDAARELCQSTWARLIEQHARGALERLELPGVAIRQARFLALDFMRKQGSERRWLGAGVDITEVVTESDIEREVLSREMLDRTLTALGRCTEREQNVFRLLYSPPIHTHSEVAAELGLSLQRVRQILCELRKKLRGALSEE